MASNRIKGITIEIGGDTTGLSAALGDVNKKINNTAKEQCFLLGKGQISLAPFEMKIDNEL